MEFFHRRPILLVVPKTRIKKVSFGLLASGRRILPLGLVRVTMFTIIPLARERCALESPSIIRIYKVRLC